MNNLMEHDWYDDDFDEFDDDFEDEFDDEFGDEFGACAGSEPPTARGRPVSRSPARSSSVPRSRRPWRPSRPGSPPVDIASSRPAGRSSSASSSGV